ncbi:hypothetical protein [Streptomyces sp. NPDC093094]|uniref:hypothetical protein n=1 Tax=Streptomyces sp. NPDC093094 TaxID=3366026 RepID=UPI00380406E2
MTWSDKALASAAGMAQVRHRMRRVARGGRPRPGTHPAVALIAERRKQHKALRRYRAWLPSRGTVQACRRAGASESTEAPNAAPFTDRGCGGRHRPRS